MYQLVLVPMVTYGLYPMHIACIEYIHTQLALIQKGKKEGILRQGQVGNCHTLVLEQASSNCRRRS